MSKKLATTREELQELERQEFGAVGACINWELMDRLIKEGHEFNESLKDSNLPKHEKRVYVYNLQGQLLGVYGSQTEVSEAYGIKQAEVSWAMKADRPYWTGRLYFTREPSTRTFTEEEISKGLKKKKIYVYTLDYKTLIGEYDSPKEAAKALGIPNTSVAYYANVGKPYYKKGYYFTNKPITFID